MGKLNEETIWNFQAFMNSKKNSCRGNYMRKYGMWFFDILYDIIRETDAGEAFGLKLPPTGYDLATLTH